MLLSVNTLRHSNYEVFSPEVCDLERSSSPHISNESGTIHVVLYDLGGAADSFLPLLFEAYFFVPFP